MLELVAIVGIGYTPLRSISPEISYREIIFEAAVKAYRDAGITPHEVSTFVSVTEDFIEGTAIADEYVPDQLGAVLKPVHMATSAASRSFTVLLEEEPLDPPVVVALVGWPGVRGGLIHRVLGVDPNQVTLGMAVEPVWADTHLGAMSDMSHFRPVAA